MKFRPLPCPAVLALHPTADRALRFAVDICNMASPLFTGLPAMLQNPPFMKHRALNQLQTFQVHLVRADMGKIVLRLLHQPAVCGTAENLR